MINNSSINNQGSAIATMYTNGTSSDMLTQITNCVLYNNPQPQLYNLATNGRGNLQMYTSIVWNSGSPYAGPLSAGNNVLIDMCDLDLVTPSGSNLDVDPQFTNPATGDFHTPHCSPLVDQGFTTAAFNVGHTDPDGNPRLLGPKTDIGLYESQLPPYPTVTDAVYCQYASASHLNATALSGNTLLWYTGSTGGTGSATPITPSTATASSFPTYYYVSQVDKLGCEGPRYPIKVTINAAATAPTTTPANFCQNSAPTALNVTGTSLNWYTTATGGTGSSSAPEILTTTVGSTTWYVSQAPIGSCESQRTPITVTIDPNPIPDFTWSDVCAGTGTSISAVTSTPAAENYSWNFANAASVSGSGAGPYEIVWNSDGNYSVTLTTTTGTCQNHAQHNVTVYAVPKVSINPVTTPICAGSSVTLTATGAYGYQWSPAADLSNPAISSPIALLQNDMLYTVTGTDANGCSASAQILLQISTDCSIGYSMPDAFTPNGDGHNDLFRMKTSDVPKTFSIAIFNRYGGKVFESKDIAAGWDGTIGGNPAPTGAYVYIIVLTTSAGNEIKKQGTVMLIR